MDVLGLLISGYVPFVLSALPISYAAWPKTGKPYRVIASLALAAILVVFNSFLLATTRPGVTLGTLLVCAALWFVLGGFVYLLSVGRISFAWVRRGTVASGVAKLGVGNWILIFSAILLLTGLVLIPIIVDLSGNLLWRYRAYMAALAGVAVLGACLRKKAKTVLLGLLLVFSISLVDLFLGVYPTGTPLLHAASLITEGAAANISFADVGGLRQASATISRFALISDVIVMALAVCLVGVSAVVLTNAMLGRPTGRTILSLVLVVILLVPGLLIPYVYSLGVGALEFGGNLGIGALESAHLVDLVDVGEISNRTLSEAGAHLRSAGERFLKSERLLIGLDRLRLFGFVSLLPVIGEYSYSVRCIAWALPNAAIGLQTSALGVLAILDGILCVFDHNETATIDSFDVVGLRLMNEDLDQSLVRRGILEIDSAFPQIILGFPRIRSSIGNLSKVHPEVFEKKFPDVSDSLEQLLANASQLADGMDAMEVLLGHHDGVHAPATSFLFASYSFARISPRFTDIREPEKLPDMDDMVSNLSEVNQALSDPVIRRLRNEGGEVGDSLSFLVDAVDLAQRMAGVGEYAKQVALGIEGVRGRFEEKAIQNLTDIELEEWDEAVATVIEDANDLSQRTQAIEDDIQAMIEKVVKKQYGYANDLAKSSIELLRGAMDFLVKLDGLSELSLGLKSLVDAVRSFRDFYYQFERLQRQIEVANWGAAEQALDDATQLLRSGRMQTEYALVRLEKVGQEIELPIDEQDIERVIDEAGSIQLKLVSIDAQVAAHNQEQALALISEMRSDFSRLAEELRLRQAS